MNNKTATRDSIREIIMETKTKKYVLTSEINMWVMWKQDMEGNYNVNEIFLKSNGTSRYDDRNAAISKMVVLDLAEQKQGEVQLSLPGFNGA
jgi:hypothetical protein